MKRLRHTLRDENRYSFPNEVGAWYAGHDLVSICVYTF
jgi:hypothetical protein